MHTPGPWDLERDRAKSLSIYAGRTFIGEVYDENDEETAETKANARLIAAAPDLLEALKAVNAMMHTQGIDDNEEERVRELIEQAIAKAEGRTT